MKCLIKIFIGLVFCSLTYAQKTPCLLVSSETLGGSDHTQLQRIDISYNAHKDIVSKKMQTLYMGVPINSADLYTYNTLNQLVSQENYFKGKLTSSFTFQYDISGNLIAKSDNINNLLSNRYNLTEGSSSSEIISFNREGNISTRTITKKTDNEEVVEVFNGKNELLKEEITIFNKEGKKLSYQIIEPHIKQTEGINYEYNSGNQLVSETHTANGTATFMVYYGYDGNHMVLQRGVLPKGKEEYRVEYKYSNNLEIAVLNYSNGELYTTVEKKYDSKNNLVQEITSNNQGQILTSRNFKYDCE